MADNKENAEAVFHYSPELEKKRALFGTGWTPSY